MFVGETFNSLKRLFCDPRVLHVDDCEDQPRNTDLIPRDAEDDLVAFTTFNHLRSSRSFVFLGGLCTECSHLSFHITLLAVRGKESYPELLAIQALARILRYRPLAVKLLLQTESGADEVPIDGDKCRNHPGEDRERNPHGDVCDAEEAVAEAVDEVKNRIDVGEALGPCGE